MWFITPPERNKGQSRLVSQTGSLPPVGLMLDYDGTLTPIVEDPAAAHIAPQHLQVLRELAALYPQVQLAVVSGRSVEQLLGFLGGLAGERVWLSGLHGGQLYDCHNNRFLHEPEPALRGCIQQLEHTLTQADHADACLLRLENKGYSLAAHYRHLTDNDERQRAIEAFLLACEPLVASHDPLFRLQHGKCVLELVPRQFTKGRGVALLAEGFVQHLPQGAANLQLVYAGDDLTDEHAFEAVNERNGVSVLVGQPDSHRDTLANQRVHSVDEFYEWLRLCITAYTTDRED